MIRRCGRTSRASGAGRLQRVRGLVPSLAFGGEGVQPVVGARAAAVVIEAVEGPITLLPDEGVSEGRIPNTT
jgi:hypothetical protein